MDYMNVKKFKYTKLLNSFIQVSRGTKMLGYTEYISTESKLTRKKGLMKMDTHLQELTKGNELNRLKAKELRLEREYLWKLEENRLRSLIHEKLDIDNVSCDYTLQEIGKVLGISRERTRQIEDAAKKILKHHDLMRKLRPYADPDKDTE